MFPPLPSPSFYKPLPLLTPLPPPLSLSVLPNHNPLGLPRFSIPFFLSPDLEKRVVPIPVASVPWYSPDSSLGGKGSVVSEVRAGDLTVDQVTETYGVSSWRGTTRSHRHVMEKHYPEEQRRMDGK